MKQMLSVEKIPMSASEHNLSTQPAAKRHPLLVPVGTTFPPQAGAQYKREMNPLTPGREAAH